MFGTKSAKKEAIKSNGNSSATMVAVSQTMDALEATLEQEQQASTPAAVESHGTVQNSIGKGTIIEGNVRAEGDLLIDGIIKGDVTTKTKLICGPSALIEGNILAQHAEIAGRVQGTVKALGLLVINSSGTILGDVITKDLNVESGSTFNGRLQVGGNVTAQPIEIPKVKVSPVVPVMPVAVAPVMPVAAAPVIPVAVAPIAAAPVAPAPVAAESTSFDFIDSVFDAPARKPSVSVVSSAKSEMDKAADQLAANLAKSAMLR